MATERVLIVGAGVSGCSTAIRLMQQGIVPLIIDKADFPRDTVGEGLSPAVGVYLAELGLLDAVDAGPFKKKVSFQLVAPSGSAAYTAIDFSRPAYAAGVHRQPWGYNVRRKHFDMLFLERVRAMGARVELRTSLVGVERGPDGAVVGATLRSADGTERKIKTELVIDCAGRQSVLAKLLDLRVPLRGVFEGQWANFACRLHFSDVDLEPFKKQVPHYDPATVNILPDDNCWYWFIPIEDNLVSVGFVARSRLHKFFEGTPEKGPVARQLMLKHPVLSQVLKNAALSDNVVFTSQLGHMNSRFAGAGWMSVGDAAFFADPAWATGVTISLKTSKMAAEIAGQALTEGDLGAASMGRYEQAFRAFVQDPFNSIRAWNHYYNDIPYLNFVVEHLREHQDDMDLLGAVLFDYTSHEQFDRWTYRIFRDYFRKYGRMPTTDKLSQYSFESGAVGSPA